MYWIMYQDLLQDTPLLVQILNGREVPFLAAHQKIRIAVLLLASVISFEQMDEMVRRSPEIQRFYFTLSLRKI